MMKREGSVRTLEIIKECADAARSAWNRQRKQWKLNSLSELQTLSKALADTSAALQAVSAAVERSASLGTFCWTRNSKHRIAVLLPE